MKKHLLIGLLMLAFVPAVMAAGTRDFLDKPDSWFASEEAKIIATNLLSYQSDYGGWPKKLDVTAGPFAGEPVDLVGDFKPTFDDGATIGEVRFMTRMFQATKDTRYLRAVESGIDYILIAQYPAGDWPPYYPPDRQANYKSESMAGIVSLLQEIGTSKDFEFLDADRLSAVRSAIQRSGPTGVPWQPKVRIALAGDSTVTDSAGWGFGFKKNLVADVLCENFAGGGQSSKSFRGTGQWQKTLASKPAYVLIQFGHNDMPGKGPNRETDPATTYAENLTRFIAEARQAGAKPILVTSLARRIFEKDGKLRGELAPYAAAARKVAAEQKVPLIDLYARSIELTEKLGPVGVEPFNPKTLPKASAQPGAPADIDIPAPSAAPRRDGTHLTAQGSIEFGRIVAEELSRLLPETTPFFRK